VQEVLSPVGDPHMYPGHLEPSLGAVLRPLGRAGQPPLCPGQPDPVAALVLPLGQRPVLDVPHAPEGTVQQVRLLNGQI